MTTLYLLGFVVAMFFIVRGIIDICRDLDRSDMTERDE